MTRQEIAREYRGRKSGAKKAYRRERKMIKGEYESRLDAYYDTDEYKLAANPPRRSLLEEIGNAVTHGVGSLLSLVAFFFMLWAADTTIERVAASVYFAGMFLMFTMSCLYHSFAYGSKVKRLFRRFDYSSIYLMIGATFTPILLCYMGGAFGIIFCVAQWSIIAVGITFIGVFGPTRLRFLHFPLYVVLGWSALAFLPRMVTHDLTFFFWILGGGVVYTLGIIPFAMNKKVSHFLWHFFVLFGAAVQWVGIFLHIYLT